MQSNSPFIPFVAVITIALWPTAAPNVLAATAHTTILQQTKIDQIQLKQVPLWQALALIDEISACEILIDRQIMNDKRIPVGKSINLTARNHTIERLLDKILPPDVALVVRGKQILVTTIERAQNRNRQPSGTVSNYISVSELAVNSALRQRIPMHFDETPLEIVLQMIGGFSGHDIRLSRGLRRQNIDHALVTIHRDNSTLADCLRAVLKPHGLTSSIKHGRIVISAKRS